MCCLKPPSCGDLFHQLQEADTGRFLSPKASIWHITVLLGAPRAPPPPAAGRAGHASAQGPHPAPRQLPTCNLLTPEHSALMRWEGEEGGKGERSEILNMGDWCPAANRRARRGKWSAGRGMGGGCHLGQFDYEVTRVCRQRWPEALGRNWS